MPSLPEVVEAIEASWGPDTAQDANVQRGPASGQCCVSSLVLLTYFDGTLVRLNVLDPEPIVHYCVALTDHGQVDITMSQFSDEAVIEDFEFDPPTELYWFQDTEEKYLILLDRVRKHLGTDER